VVNKATTVDTQPRPSMAKKRGASSHTAGSPEPPTSPLRAPIPPPPPTESPDPVTVSNPYNANDLKIACDDALRRYIARPDTSFSTVNRHTDVRLALGWASVLVAAATAGWGYKVEFERAKTGLWIGFILFVFLVSLNSSLLMHSGFRYLILTTAQTAYIYFIEGQTIFIGKRKTYAKRVETEHIRVESRTVTPRYSHMRIGVRSPENAPNYELGMSYIRLTNGGKTLIHKVIRPFVQVGHS